MRYFLARARSEQAIAIPRWFLWVNGSALALGGLFTPFVLGWFIWATNQLITISVKVEGYDTGLATLTSHMANTNIHTSGDTLWTAINSIEERVGVLEGRRERRP
jgi:hypothetical protein